MTIFVDTSILIAYIDVRDSKHQQGLQILKDVISGNYGAAYFSDYVFDEAITFLFAKSKDVNVPISLGDFLLNSEINILTVSKELFDLSWVLFKQRKNISFTDCTIVETMRKHGIKNLATFDNGFKQFKKEFNILGLE
ncbi:MAG: PIN domain-containing protein [Candidatus Diapherotrites archaeon]|nr:PIN domain-containing protein [Candidatus Diapherotrites archaeon]